MDAVAAETKIEMVSLDRFDLSCQTRAIIDESAVREYASRIRGGGRFDPAVAYLGTTGGCGSRVVSIG